ncbi:MAG: entericidin A/B family lipoprotein [Verrucomicrobiota bacterium]
MGRAVILGTFLIAFVCITGCKNTAHGVGKDVERAGEKIQDKTQ